MRSWMRVLLVSQVRSAVKPVLKILQPAVVGGEVGGVGKIGITTGA